MDTIKGYLLFLVYLALDGVLSLIGTIVALATDARSVGFGFLHMRTLFLSLLLFALLLVSNLAGELPDLTWRNQPGAERQITEWTVATIEQLHGLQAVQFVTFTMEDRAGLRHPWDLGQWENTKQALGNRVWEWFLPWRQPPRVRRYGRYPGDLSDLPHGEMWWRYKRDPAGSGATRSQLLPVPAGTNSYRRSVGRSSGIEML